MEHEWVEHNGALHKTFVFSDFREALAFVNRVGAIAEELQHHPDVGVRDYNKVVVSTTTHDKGNSVTERDRGLAKAIDAI